MRVRVLYFAVVRERLKRTEEAVDLDEGATVDTLMAELCRRHDALAPLVPFLQVARNRATARPADGLAEGDEVALIPPVAGGAGPAPIDEDRPFVAIREQALSLDEAVARVSHGGAGGVVTFTGAVRSESRGRRVMRLEYEAYPAMAEATMAAIARSIGETHGARVAIVHRVGVLSVGEVAVVIAVAAPHRAEAFAACREAIERLKRDVPIWKKEVYEGGAEWIGLGP